MNGSPIIVQLEITCIIRAFHLHHIPFSSSPGRIRTVNWVLGLFYVVVRCIIFLYYFDRLPLSRGLQYLSPILLLTPRHQHNITGLALLLMIRSRPGRRVSYPSPKWERGDTGNHLQLVSSRLATVRSRDTSRYLRQVRSSRDREDAVVRENPDPGRRGSRLVLVRGGEIENVIMLQLAAKQPTYHLDDNWKTLLPIKNFECSNF